MTENQPERPFVTSREIVNIAHVHPQTIYYWRVTGKIKPVAKVSQVLLYDREEVMKFLRKRKEKQRKQRERKKESAQSL